MANNVNSGSFVSFSSLPRDVRVTPTLTVEAEGPEQPHGARSGGVRPRRDARGAAGRGRGFRGLGQGCQATAILFNANKIAQQLTEDSAKVKAETDRYAAETKATADAALQSTRAAVANAAVAQGQVQASLDALGKANADFAAKIDSVAAAAKAAIAATKG